MDILGQAFIDREKRKANTNKVKGRKVNEFSGQEAGAAKDRNAQKKG